MLAMGLDNGELGLWLHQPRYMCVHTSLISAVVSCVRVVIVEEEQATQRPSQDHGSYPLIMPSRRVRNTVSSRVSSSRGVHTD
jgi:hypothetical protein